MLNELISGFVIVVSLIISVFVAAKIDRTIKRGIFLGSVVFISLAVIMSASTTLLVNHFSVFETPESAFKYSNSEEIVDVVQGDDSCLVVYKKSNSEFGDSIHLKSNNRYNFQQAVSFPVVRGLFVEHGVLSAYKVLGTDDYYITGVIYIENNELPIVNSNNQEVKCIVVDETGFGGTNTKTVLVYDAVDELDSNYYLVINNQRVTFK